VEVLRNIWPVRRKHKQIEELTCSQNSSYVAGWIPNKLSLGALSGRTSRFSATMQRMFTRRSFVSMTAATLAGHALGAQEAGNPAPAVSGQASAQFSVMIWTLKKEGTFEENLERVAQAGYHHVELVGEFKTWSDEDYRRILARMEALRISPDATSGVGPGFADPSGRDAFLAALKDLIPTAKRLQCKQIILLSGKVIDGAAPGSQHAASIEALKRAADLLSSAGLVAVIEPIDRIENPTIYLDGVTEAFEIAKAVDNPHIRVLYDVYHEQRQFGNLIEKFEKNIDLVGLIHIADVPGRHEPGTGEIHYLNIYRKLAQLGYKGTLAMEFYPTGDIVETLRRARDQARSILS
jgi:hydroxypyruvate isomerase